MKVKEFTREIYDKLIETHCDVTDYWIPPYEVLWLCHKRVATYLVTHKNLTKEAIPENKAIEHMFKGKDYWEDFLFKYTPEGSEFWLEIFAKNNTTKFYEYWPTCPDRIANLTGVEKFLHHVLLINEFIEKCPYLT